MHHDAWHFFYPISVVWCLHMGLSPKKSLGQHFLNNPHVPKLMADAADVRKGDTVLEVGPGTGVLTRELLLRGARVIAIETDHRAIEMLKKTYAAEIAANALTIVDADMRTAKLSDLGLSDHAYKIVANIPYYLSGMLLRTFLETDIQPTTLVFLVQKEVAERIARSTKESLLSLSVKAYGEPQYIQTVKKGNFSPVPRVDSAILLIKDISHDRLQGIDEAFFFEMLHAGFASRRKQLVGNLTKKISREQLAHIFSTCEIHPKARGEDLTIQKWLELVQKIYTQIIPTMS